MKSKMNKPIFIVGCDRSGTTLLSLLLSQSPDLHMTLESGFIPKLYKKKECYGNFQTSEQRHRFIRDLQHTNATSKTIAFDIFELSYKEAVKTIEQAAPIDYAGAVNALFCKTAQANSKPRWGNKTPRYIYHIDLLTRLFPHAKIIHLIRDPRDVVTSIMKTNWVPTTKDAALYWNDRVSKGLKGRELGNDQYFELKFEELLQSPGKVLNELAEWLKITFGDNVLSNYQNEKNRIPTEHENLFGLIDKPIDKSRAYAWKRNMARADVAEIEHINYNLIQVLNYETTGYKVPISRKLYRKIYHFLKTAKKKITFLFKN